MATIISFTPKPTSLTKKKGTPVNVRQFMPDYEPAEENEQSINLTFFAIDEYRTAVIGDIGTVRPLIMELDGTVNERKTIKDKNGNKRGPGLILTVSQVLQLITMIENDGWDLENPEVRQVAQARYDRVHIHPEK